MYRTCCDAGLPFLLIAADYTAGRCERKTFFLTLRSRNVHFLRICPKNCRTKISSSDCTKKYNRYASCTAKVMCVISSTISHIVLWVISKPLAQQILCLFHRGSATTLSIVLSSYFSVSVSAIKAFFSLTTWQSLISPTRCMDMTQFLPPISVKGTPTFYC